jgi:membrane-bound ClpP family serine protease
LITLVRYIGFQLPSWGIASMIALGLDMWTSIPRMMIGLPLILYVMKDFLIYPYVRAAYENRPHDAGESVVGAPARVLVTLDPDGWVQIGSERWRARQAEGGPVLEVGARVQVSALQGHTVLVVRVEEGS